MTFDYEPSLHKNENATRKKVFFILECSSSQDEDFVAAQKNSCEVSFSMKTPLGCLNKPHGTGFFGFLFYFLLIAGAYLGIGYFINSKVSGLSGLQALPNIEFWEKVSTKGIEVVHYLKRKTLFYVRNLQ